MKFGSLMGICLSSANLICRSTDISKFSEGPFHFEITRVDCILYRNYPSKLKFGSAMHVICTKYAYETAYSVEPDQTAPSGAV